MTAPAFATPWEFLYSWVLVAVSQEDGTFAGGSQSDGTTSVFVWTDPSFIPTAPTHRPAQLKARDLITMLPDDVGIVVNPGRDDTIVASLASMERFRALCHPFPAGHLLEFKEWVGLPPQVRDAVVEAARARPFVTEVRALLYVVGDSPHLGCLAYEADGGAESHESTAAELQSTLSRVVDLASLGVPTVNIVGLVDLPTGVRDDLPPQTLLYRRPS